MYVKFLQRKTLKETDILDALTETEFDDLVPLVMSELEAAKVKKANKVKLFDIIILLNFHRRQRRRKTKKKMKKVKMMMLVVKRRLRFLIKKTLTKKKKWNRDYFD